MCACTHTHVRVIPKMSWVRRRRSAVSLFHALCDRADAQKECVRMRRNARVRLALACFCQLECVLDDQVDERIRTCGLHF